jgi:hypothetical protein
MIIVFAGAFGRFPIGGHAWAEMQYLLGLRDLGHDIFFLEECGQESWVYNWETEQLTTELDYPIKYVRDCLEPIDLGNQWIYRAGEQSAGMRVDEFRDVCSQADLLFIRSCPIPLWRDEYFWPKRRIYVDTDPGFTQVHIANGHSELVSTVERCERLFTNGQLIGTSGCPIPIHGKNWQKTVFPVFLPHWPQVDDEKAANFTSIMQWHSYEEVIYEGVTYGNKNKEFPKFIDLPRLAKQPFFIALTGGFPEQIAEYGWEVASGWATTFTPAMYRKFIQESRAEFGVAKHGYVQMRSGWLSDRSVCYLASGRPILVQDTGQSDWLATREGLLTFRDVPEALHGIECINADYERHRRAARRLAEEYFAADKVLSSLLEAAMD